MTGRHPTHSSVRRQTSTSLPHSATIPSPTRHHRQQQITPPPSNAPQQSSPPFALHPHQYPTAATLSLLPTTTTTVVTTTTTTTTTFPPLVLPPPPKVLDTKLYPLADTPTPPALKKFCFDLNGQPTWFKEDDDAEAALRKVQEAMYNNQSGKRHTTETTVQTMTQSNLPPGMESPSARSPLRTSPRKRPASPYVVQTYDHHDPSIALNTKTVRPPTFERPFRKITSPPHKRPRGPIISVDGTVDGDGEMDKEGTPESLSSGEDYTQEEMTAMETRGSFNPTVVRTTVTTVDSPSPVPSPVGHIVSPGLAPTHPRVRPINPPLSADNALSVSDTSALPSPSLSPITAGGLSTVANMDSYFNGGESAVQLNDRRRKPSNYVEDDEEQDVLHTQLAAHGLSHVPSLLDLPTMLATFDALPSSLKSYLLFHLVRRSPQSTLQFVSSTILPALKRDFLGGLPYELSLHILRFLDVKSMCRAAQVNRKWRVVVDADPGTWRRKLEADGFKLEDGEEERAEEENWGLFGLQKRKRPSNVVVVKRERDGAESKTVVAESSRGQADPENVMMVVDEPVVHDVTVSRRTLTRRDSKAKEEHMWIDSDREQVGSSRGVTRRQKRLENVDHQDGGIDADIDDDDSAPPLSSFKGSPRRPRKANERSQARETVGKTRRSKRASKAAVYNDDTETGSSAAEQLDNHHVDDDAMSQNSDDWTPQTAQVAVAEPKLPLSRSNDHPYKAIYRRHHIIRQNWDRGDARHISFQGHGNNVVTCLQFDNDKILSGSDDHCINVYDTSTGEKRKTLIGHEGGVWALQYVGNTLVSGSTDRTVRVWDIERGTCTHIFHGHTSTVRCLQIVMPTNVNPDPHGPPIMEPEYPLIVTGSRDSSLRVWKLPDPAKDPEYLPDAPNSPADHSQTYNPYHRHTLTGHTHSVRALAAVGNILVSGSYDNSIRVWNIWTGDLIHHMEGHSQKVYSVVLDPSRKRCMSGSMDSTVRIWSLEDGACIGILDGHSMLVGLLGLSNNYLVSAAADSTLRIWSAATGVCNHVLSGHHGAITCFQHDDRKVISGSDGGLKMWNIRTGQLTRDLITNLNGVWRVAFDERRCVCAVKRNDTTFFEVLDFGVHNLEEQDSLEGIDAGNGRVIVGPGYGW